MKKVNLLKILIVFLPAFHVNSCYSQYFQWAKSYFEKHGIAIHDLVVDDHGNSYLAGMASPALNSSAFYLVKVNSAGILQWKISKLPVNTSQAKALRIALDPMGNCYVTGLNNTNQGSIGFNGLVVQAGAFLAKFSPQGICLRLDSLGDTSAPFAVATDQIGNVYLTNGLKTTKIDSNGIIRWENTSHGGNEISIDANRYVYLLSGNSYKKLNNLGGFSWSRSFGGLKMATDQSGNSFITCNDSIFKVKPSGTIEWRNKALHGNDIALDASGKIYLAIGNNLRKVDVNGTSVLWSLSAQNTFFKVISTANGNCFTAGDFDPINETVIGPFHFTRVGALDPFNDNKGFLTKINLLNPPPFQACIYTPPIPGDRLCSGVFFQVPYVVSLGPGSAFGQGNEFRAELINPVSGDTIDIGKADSALIPLSVTPSVSCRIRVVSTNPVVIGDPNSPQALTPDLNLEHLSASLSPYGPVSICSGQTINLQASVSPSNFIYYWYKNSVLFSSGIVDSIKSIGQSGDYYYDVYTSDYICKLSSPVAHVNVNPNPLAVITASGPLSFCSGDSVELSTVAVTGFLYQWRKNNNNIPGATSSTYIAKTSGNYKVKVTNTANCTAVSAGKTVSVNCKTGSGDHSFVSVVPILHGDGFYLEHEMRGRIDLFLYDLSSSRLVMKKENLHSSFEFINMTGQAPGIYLLQLTNGNEVRNMKLSWTD